MPWDTYADELSNRVMELEAAIRKHRDQRGDDRCWMDDEELYRVLPEGYTVPVRDTAVELANCERFIRCRHNPGTVYVSPQREIEELKALSENGEKFIGRILFQLEKMFEHFTAEGELAGDGKWRIRSIWQCLKEMKAAEDEAAADGKAFPYPEDNPTVPQTLDKE